MKYFSSSTSGDRYKSGSVALLSCSNTRPAPSSFIRLVGLIHGYRKFLKSIRLISFTFVPLVAHTKIERKAKEKNKKILSSYGPNISLRKPETLNGDCDDPTNISYYWPYGSLRKLLKFALKLIW